ncbi:2-hydroxymuconate tautomerase family protein [Acinetobacter haemolyticus]|uniref:tautomerase family protein n=1 Tax=Acinetobacter haemolyticus TaxID=29430 RepID=UPI0002F73E40|nr:4-oxalocrotonate tautomerase family protein [Acinetobacter haemolyticus]NAR55260.1 2-hydroxymuconate tautomerase family protein [Acinetobacter haemolyticus]NAR97785.1 2-hydroxymuconate tautomerase family protein [Acinetobacter haemolyticus]SUU08883.1 Probable tautomerase HP_0924 [Acinetobacter haemolyticus]
MPFVSVKVTGGNEAPTVEQKKLIIEGITQLLSTVLNKNPATTMVIIDEIEMDNWGVAGKTTTERRQEAQK